MHELEPVFPLEFLVFGTPLSHQGTNPRAKAEWMVLIREAATLVLPEGHYAIERAVAITLYYFPSEEMQGDIDNIIKFVLDALIEHIYMDDRQVERVVVQKFDPGRIFKFANPSDCLLGCIEGQKPVLYIRVSDDPYEGLS